MGIFGDADYEPADRLKNFKWQRKYGGPQFQKLFYLHENLMKILLQWVLGSLISNSLLVFRNSKWRN